METKAKDKQKSGGGCRRRRGLGNHICKGGRVIEPNFVEMTKELFKRAKSTSSFLLSYPPFTVNVYVTQ